MSNPKNISICIYKRIFIKILVTIFLLNLLLKNKLYNEQLHIINLLRLIPKFYAYYKYDHIYLIYLIFAFQFIKEKLNILLYCLNKWQ
jgi:hypothetical protein